MNDLKKANGATRITQEDHVLNAHQFLLDFMGKFETAQRGGIHDFIETSLYNMVTLAIKNIDDYLQGGHKQVNANEIVQIVLDSYQKVLDVMKRNIEGMKEVYFQ